MPRSDIGPVGDFLRDVAHLGPKLTRIEQFDFEIRIINQQITFQTPDESLDNEFRFALRRVKGRISNPEVNGQFAHLATFRMRDQGRGRNEVFTDPVNMGVLVGPGGPAHDMVWDSFYAFRPGADLGVQWEVELDRLPEIGDITIGISVTGDLVHVRELADGALIIPGIDTDEK